MNYTVLYPNRDSAYISTMVGDDGIARVIGEEIAYTSVHGPSASIGSSWEFSVIGEDESNPCVAQVWVRRVDGRGEEFKPSGYLAIKAGRVSFSSLEDELSRLS